MRAANKGKAKEKRKRLEAIWKEMEEPPVDLKAQQQQQ
jgi:COX assembly protein 2